MINRGRHGSRFAMRLSPSLRSMLVIDVLLTVALLSVLLSPLTLPEGSVSKLDGSIGLVDNWEELQDMPWPQRMVYLIGDINCHQQAERSYVLNGNQLPVCARDLGLLAGLVVGMGAYMIVRRPVKWFWLALFLVPMALDGGLQAVSSYESDNLIRALTGALAGSGLGGGAGTLVDRFFGREEASKASPERSSQR